jgi:hypothetical protein
MNRTKNILIALDQFCNAVSGGWPDETLSSRVWRMEAEGGKKWPRKLLDALFFWEKERCLLSWQAELTRAQMPPALRGEASPPAQEGEDMSPVIFFCTAWGVPRPAPPDPLWTRPPALSATSSPMRPTPPGGQLGHPSGPDPQRGRKIQHFRGREHGRVFAAHLAGQYQARAHESRMVNALELPKGSIVVFDKGYFSYSWFRLLGEKAFSL